MSLRTEYMEALAAFGMPTFAAVSFGLSFAVFCAALVVMYARSHASLGRQARLPLDPLGAEQDHV